LKWEWYSDLATRVLFIHLLLKANHKDREWKGVSIKRGQLITGRISLAEDTGLTQQQVRTALKRLESTSDVTIETTSKNSVITICKYDDYQSKKKATNQVNNQRSNQQLTNNQPATNQQSTTNKNDNNSNNDKNEEKYNTVELYPTFDDFWNDYNHKQDRPRCEKLWAKLDHPTKLEIIAHVGLYVLATPEKKYRKHPATYLHNKSWRNEIENSDGTSQKKFKGNTDSLILGFAARYGPDVNQ
jgi:hypothetical protein